MLSTKIRLVIFFEAKDGKALYSSKNKTGSWPWLTSSASYAKFRPKLKKVGKTIRPFRYDLNQIPFDSTVEVTNRFRGLDLVDRVPENYGWRFITLYRRQWSKPFQKKKKCKKVKKVVVWGSLTNSWEKKRSERQRRKGKIYPTKCRVPENSKET